MNCEICHWLKIIVNETLGKGDRPHMIEVRRLARSHYLRFHPDPFEDALDADDYMN